MADADIRLKIGPTGGANPTGESANIIKTELQKALSSGIPIKITLDKKSLESIRTQIKQATQDISVGVSGGATGKTQGAGSALDNEFKLYNARQRSIAQARVYENIDVSIKGHGDARLKQLNQQYTLLEKSSTAAQKLAEQEYIAYNNQQRKLDQTRMYDNIDKSVKGDLKNDADYQNLKKYFAELEKVTAKEAQRDAKLAETTAKINANAVAQKASFQQYLQTLDPRILSQYGNVTKEIFDNLDVATNGVGEAAETAMNGATNGIKRFRAAMKEAGAEGGNVFTYLQGKLQTFIVYLASSAITMGVIGGIRKAIDVVHDLDKALTDLRIVTGSSKNDAKELLNTYSQMAQTLGSTTAVVAQSANDWLRQGYSIADTNTLIKDSMVLSIVGDMDSADATSALTAALKGYRLEISDVIGVVDKFTRVDLDAATSSGKLAIALSKTAANAKLAGLSLDDVIGQLAVVNETMSESGEETGTFYNTMLSRMSSIKSGELIDPQSAESLSDVETTLTRLGIRLRDSSSEFRNFGAVLDEVGQSWEKYSSVDQRAIAQAFSGTRQQTRFLSLMQGWEQAQKYAESAANSAGTAMEKFGSYEESLEAKSNKLTAAFENMANSIIPRGIIEFFLDLGAGLANAAASLGGWPVKIAAITSAVIAFGTAIKMVQSSTIAASFTKTIKDLGKPEYDGHQWNIVPSHSKKAA